MGILCTLIGLYTLAVLARIVLSWFPQGPGSPLARVEDVLRTLTDPVLEPLRRTIPPLRLGAVALDLSPIIVLIGLQVLAGFVC